MGASGRIAATTDIAPNAVTQTGFAAGSTSSPTTTSTSLVDLAEMSVTLTTVGGDVIAMFSGRFSNDTALAAVVAMLQLDGANAVDNAANVAGNGSSVSLAVGYRWTGVAAGSHTVKVQWRVSGGTGTAVSTSRSLTVLEVKR